MADSKKKPAKRAPLKSKAKKPAKKPGKTGTRYTAKTWAEIQAAYESGKYEGLTDLHTNYTPDDGMMPSIDRLKQRCSKESWDKFANASEIKEARHEMYRRLAREAGMGEIELMKKVVEMINNEGDRNNGIQRMLDITGDRTPHKIARTDDEGNAVPETVFVVPANGFEPTR